MRRCLCILGFLLTENESCCVAVNGGQCNEMKSLAEGRFRMKKADKLL
jgi:hypothetical protein